MKVQERLSGLKNLNRFHEIGPGYKNRYNFDVRQEGVKMEEE